MELKWGIVDKYVDKPPKLWISQILTNLIAISPTIIIKITINKLIVCSSANISIIWILREDWRFRQNSAKN